MRTETIRNELGRNEEKLDVIFTSQHVHCPETGTSRRGFHLKSA